MRIKILFIIPSLANAGAEKSLVNLLKTIDCNRYDIDLLILSKNGQLESQVNEKVNILPLPELADIFMMPLKKSLFLFAKRRELSFILNRILVAGLTRLLRKTTWVEFVYWKYLSKTFPVIEVRYDVAIGYLEGISFYFVIDKVKAGKKIGWVHLAYSQSIIRKRFDNILFKGLDRIVTVSDKCSKILKDLLPEYANKIRVMQNIVFPSLIIQNSKLSNPFKDENINIVTVGRLVRQKGHEIAVAACKMLVDDGYNIKWYVLGDGQEKEKLHRMIKKNRLEGVFILLGTIDNPYPYIGNSQIYVHPSRVEGKSLSIEEAKILGRPIVATNFNTVSDQITDNVNGLIAKMSPEGLYAKIKYLIDNESVRKQLAYNLSNEKLGTEAEISKFYELINELNKKNIIFIINNLNCGGAEKALVSLLKTIDYSRYNVDLYLFKKEGQFLKQVPKEVEILASPGYYKYFDMSFKRAVLDNLKAGKFKLIIYRILAGLVSKTEKIKTRKEQKVWKYLKKVIEPLNKEYDVAIGFLEKTPNYFCVDKVRAKKKIGFIMTDYERSMMNKSIDDYYFAKLDCIVSDSEESKAVLERVFPQFKEKFKVLKSIIYPALIKRLANEQVSDFPEGTKLISVGRLAYSKGYDLAIQACKILSNKGYQFKWYILGEGEDRELLKGMIESNKLSDFFVFLGIRENHYPYLKQADIFVHTARFEGFGIVVCEAKILNKPMVITNFSVARSHIKHDYNGLIADLNPESIAENIERLIRSEELRNKFSDNLAKGSYGTEDEIANFYKIIEN